MKFLLMVLMATVSHTAAESFDFIIVGAGSSGSIVARRLADEGYSVVLFEAGPERHSLSFDPDTFFFLNSPFLNDDFADVHWDLGPHDKSLVDGRLVQEIRAKMEGGCSAHNAMLYARGAPADWDQWADKVGDCDWEYSKLIDHFEDIEDLLVRTTGSEAFDSISNAMVESAETLGYDLKESYNSGDDMDGVYPYHATINANNVRVTSHSEYVLGTGSTVVMRNRCEVKKVIFDQSEGDAVATGVEVECEGELPEIIDANVEVILSAGVYNSPLLLWYSGIGEAGLIEDDLGITLISDLPGVGKNLHNHFFIATDWEIAEVVPGRDMRDASLAFVNPDDDGRPEAVIFVGGRGTNAARCSGEVLDLKSAGEMTFNTVTNDWEFDQKWLSDPVDRQTTLNVFHTMMDLMTEDEAENGLSTFSPQLVSPNPSEVDITDDDEVFEWIKSVMFSGSHPMGTCKMGSSGDNTAVVDSNFKVFGTENLRVIDASVFPFNLQVHTQGPAFLIGERGAAIIIDAVEDSSTSSNS